VDYMCGDCGDADVIETRAFGQIEAVARVCAACGSEYILGHDASTKYKRTQPPSVGQMLHRQRKAEQQLPPTAMERTILAKKTAAAREDLVELLTELA
jgi:hypothetical protein